ncbi:tetratricopeptide repeat protein [Leptothoe spongobia]|uniref:Tetratricopeptide repeat protein n=1 Tax=Leptothoe spongobia TAU-MAC 1115 TaxID=1967444 RepID=A0A947DDF7_9CYAN|nr:hypothetical protein [Leptothoe spongobia]MBT9314850.1 hypothetical protein [Leptothoe spongobia TAU-MAC 1115]
MKSLRLSIVAATLASLLASSNAHVFAQSATELQAGALLESAERLDRDSDDIDAITMAYEQALAAYDELGNTDKSLEILDTLYAINHSACRDEEAIRWASQALERFALPQRDFELRDKLFEYKRWVNLLGGSYRREGQSAQALELYKAALENLATISPSMDEDLPLGIEAEFLRSQLALQSSDSHEATVILQRIMAVRQQAGVINQINGLLSDAMFLSESDRDAPSQTAVELLQQTLELSRLHNYPSGEVQSITLLSKQALADRNYEQAISYGNLVLTEFNQLDGVGPWSADARHVLAQSEQSLGNDTEAIKHYSGLLTLINSEPDFYIEVSRYEVVSNLINLYERIGDTASANELATDYNDLLNGLLPIASIPPLTLRRPLPGLPRSFLSFRGLCLRNPIRLPDSQSSPLPSIRSQPTPVVPRPSTILPPD